MKEKWNERYAEAGYAYGTEPNEFFKEMLSQLQIKPSRMLLPAEGQGRNAVFAAVNGWQVDAFDISVEGKKKADRLATSHGVTINFEVGTLDEVHYTAESFDIIGLIFAHFPPNIRLGYHQKFIEWLKPGGYIVLEAFAKRHLELSTKNPQAGGPRDASLLFSIEEVQQEFAGLSVQLLEEKTVKLQEGKYHVGESAVIRFLGQKL